MQALTAFSSTWVNPELAPILIAIIVLAVIGTIFLFGIGLIAYNRRRTSRYLLIAVALGLLVARSVVGLGTVFGLVPMTVHHLVEHSSDVLIALVVLYAVYRTGSPTDTHSINSHKD